MFDWNWLWVVGEIGISYGFYRWWKSNDKFLAVLEVAPDIDINDLKQFSSSRTFIDYAAIHGIVRTNDSKSNSVLKSQFHPHCLGVIHRLTIREKKLEKLRNVWTETNKTISDIIRHVPFRLVSPSGNYIRIDTPIKFDSIEDQLEVIHVKFEPNTSSSIQKIVDTFLGDLSAGVETKEQMLLVDAPLTGVGRLEKQSNGIWYLVPHKKWGGILTRSTRAEIVAQYRDRSLIVRVISICFGVAAIGTAAYLLYKYYFKRRQQTNRLPNISPINNTNQTDNNSNARLHCVICLENEIVYSLQPCSHLGLCHSCAQTLQSRNRGEELCPLCRTPIQEYQRIFLP
ncbi:unnamed protein product [Rotaria sordida]|uniref:RING-type E3 ubiquitin transferase n=1 Tax=Rotaria sordida TaxID=392033 RepID=A0A815EFA5_9BILA|nr:unnamed protein product [Rotaria sordida]CAF1062413.1 unnamed protein product [Rotaria sordida]CAF1143860.1 unnamed protein product [Rotaria sordida]CAF1180877.1 unnamed protein product [Rotaria sordida]CAF1270771.1 unnamed protein product [Rotaria sordida]